MEDYKKFIENNRVNLTDENRNKWEVIEVSDLENFQSELLEQRDELLKALKNVRQWYEENQERYLGEYTPIVFSEALSAIQKTTP